MSQNSIDSFEHSSVQDSMKQDTNTSANIAAITKTLGLRKISLRPKTDTPKVASKRTKDDLSDSVKVVMRGSTVFLRRSAVGKRYETVIDSVANALLVL